MKALSVDRYSVGTVVLWLLLENIFNAISITDTDINKTYVELYWRKLYGDYSMKTE